MNLERPGPLLIELRGSRSDRLLFPVTRFWVSPWNTPAACLCVPCSADSTALVLRWWRSPLWGTRVPLPSKRRTVAITGAARTRCTWSLQYLVICYSKITQTVSLQLLTVSYFCVFFWLCGVSSSQMWLLLHGGGTRASRHLQHHPHHLPAQTGGTLFLGFCQHLTSQGLPAPMKMGGVSAEVLWDVPEAEVFDLLHWQSVQHGGISHQRGFRKKKFHLE